MGLDKTKKQNELESDPYALLDRVNILTGVSSYSTHTKKHKSQNDLPSFGQSRASLIVDYGYPDKIDKTVTKTKIKEIFKYFPLGPNRYKLKIKLENGIVTAWDSKG